MQIQIEQWYKKYGPMVYRRCKSFFDDEQEALDAMQEVFVRVLEKQDQLHEQYPSSFLYRVATNLCLNRIRSNKRNPAQANSPLTERAIGLDRAFSALEARSVLAKLFSHTAQTTRYIATLHFVDGYTYEEIAREVDMSVSGVRKRLRKLQSIAREFSDE